MQDRIAYQGITFDDVLLEPGYSEVVPKDVDVRTALTRHIKLNIPILSSPMDTVTESELAIALAQEGGIGIIHKNLSRRDLRFLSDSDQKSAEVMTKDNLVTAKENTTLEEAEQILTANKVEKLLLVDDQYRLKGLITIKDIDKMLNFPNACKDPRGRLRVGAAV